MEVLEEVVQTMLNGKAPRPDGFTIDFYKACWNTIKDSVYDLVEESRMKKSIFPSLNANFLAPIPKSEKLPRSVLTHRPLQCHLQDHIQNSGQSFKASFATPDFCKPNMICGR